MFCVCAVCQTYCFVTRTVRGAVFLLLEVVVAYPVALAKWTVFLQENFSKTKIVYFRIIIIIFYLNSSLNDVPADGKELQHQFQRAK